MTYFIKYVLVFKLKDCIYQKLVLNEILYKLFKSNYSEYRVEDTLNNYILSKYIR